MTFYWLAALCALGGKVIRLGMACCAALVQTSWQLLFCCHSIEHRLPRQQSSNARHIASSKRAVRAANNEQWNGEMTREANSNDSNLIMKIFLVFLSI